MSIWYGFAGGCVWSYHFGATTDEDWDAYLTQIVRAVQRGLPISGITVAFSGAVPTAGQRKRLGALSKESDFSKVLRAHAMVSDSAITRGALTAINWMARKGFPEKIFAAVEPALAWLDKQVPGFDRAALLAAMNEAVPNEFRRLPES